jgi:hypothetical protein
MPRSATFDKTSAQFTMLTAAPLAIASVTTSTPSSSFRTASNAEASRTDAGASTLATETPSFFGSLSRLGLCFGAPVGDQLVGEVPARGQVGEHSAHPFGGFPSTLHLGSG